MRIGISIHFETAQVSKVVELGISSISLTDYVIEVATRHGGNHDVHYQV